MTILAWLLLLGLGFVVFGVLAPIHGELLALNRVTRREIAGQLRCALQGHDEELEPFRSV